MTIESLKLAKTSMTACVGVQAYTQKHYKGMNTKLYIAT